MAWALGILSAKINVVSTLSKIHCSVNGGGEGGCLCVCVNSLKQKPISCLVFLFFGSTSLLSMKPKWQEFSGAFSRNPKSWHLSY